MSDVAVRASDSDSFGRVESYGIESIPAAGRHGAPRELAFLWAGAFVNYASLFTASLLTTYYGLGVWDGLLATAIGTVAAALILGLLSNTGPRSGRAADRLHAAHLRPPGFERWRRPHPVARDRLVCRRLRDRGAGGRPARRRWKSLGDSRPRAPIAAISVAVAILGHETIKVLATYGAIAFAALCCRAFHFSCSPVPLEPGSHRLGRRLSRCVRARLHDVLRPGRVVVPLRKRLLALPAEVQLRRARSLCGRRRESWYRCCLLGPVRTAASDDRRTASQPDRACSR